MARDTLVLRMVEAADLQRAAGQVEVADWLARAAQLLAARRFEVARRRMMERQAVAG